MTEPPGFWQKVLRSRSALVLIAANLVPLAAVIFAGWSAFDVVFLFWLENAIIGFFNVWKMITVGVVGNPVRDDPSGPPVKVPRAGLIAGMVFVCGFFIFHYGGFMFVHGVFVVELLKRGPNQMMGPDGFNLKKHIEEAITGDLAWPFVILFVSHAFSFFYNFIGKKEYQRVNDATLMFAPYARVVVLHIAIIIGGILSLFLPHFMVAMLVLLKIGLDLALHLKEHETGAITLLPRKRKDT